MIGTALAWLRGRAVWLAVVAVVAGWATIEHCRADGAARDLAAARAEVAIRDATLADQELRYESELVEAAEHARIAAEQAAADSAAESEAKARLKPIERDEAARKAAAEDGTQSDEVNRRIDAGLLPGGGP